MFCLSSSRESPSFPPEAACGFVTAKEAKVSLANVVFNPELLKVAFEDKVVKSFEGTLASTPPPV